ncbi:hypothetical protein PV11_09982 [Exophiala sideris]|uniref:Uncharacterized protein n=1 Tax=Exophiala sideris TaxID=1016849 RepID=A0A0D1WT17_9EURO|nr:hypothetical protein PV11_09982 [Exophiala sideris]
MRISIVLYLAFIASVAVSKPMPKNSHDNPFSRHPEVPTTAKPEGTTIAKPEGPTTAKPEPPPAAPAPPPVTTVLTIITSLFTFSAVITETPITTVTQILIVTPVTTVENIVTIATMTTYVPIVTVGPITTAAVVTKASTLTVEAPTTTYAAVITNTPITIISTFTTVLSPITKVSKRNMNTLPPNEARGVDPGRGNTTTKCSAPGSSDDDADISSGFLPSENVLPQVPDNETYELDRRSAQIGRAQLMDDVNLIQLKLHQVNTALQNVSCLGLEENLAIIAQQLNEAEIVVNDTQNLLLLPVGPGDLDVPASTSSILPTCQPTHRPTAIQWGATLYYCDKQ